MGTIPSASSIGSSHRASTAARSRTRRLCSASVINSSSVAPLATAPAPPCPAERRSSLYRRRASLAASSARNDRPAAASAMTRFRVFSASFARSTPLARITEAFGFGIADQSISPVSTSRGSFAAYVASRASRWRATCVPIAMSVDANALDDLPATSSARDSAEREAFFPSSQAAAAPALTSPLPTPGLVNFRPSAAFVRASSFSQSASLPTKADISPACRTHSAASLAALSPSTVARCLRVSRVSIALACAPSSAASSIRLASISVRHSHRTAMSAGEKVAGTSHARLSASVSDSSCAA